VNDGPNFEKIFWLEPRTVMQEQSLGLVPDMSRAGLEGPIFRALKWFRRAAAHGNPDAQNSLGQMYENGEGVQPDYVQAAHWYRKAAENVPDRGGAGQGRMNLGLLYMQGLGVPKDYAQAYMWFSLSHSDANLSDAKAQMTPAQVLEAERMATGWKIRHPEQ
jgi:uncharacterized protein